MNFSANTLFHYTNEMGKLFLILENGFQTSYSRELLMGNGSGKEYAVPIISFCEIPLSRVSDHVGKYGAYALGVSRDFAIANEFCKVFYLDRFSSVTKGIFAIQEYAVENFDKISDAGHDRFNDGVLSLLQVIKNNIGPMLRKTKTEGEYRFFEEMEWRYAPQVYPEHNQIYSDFEELEKAYPAKPHLPGICLPLTFRDINWIIVNKTAEIPAMIDKLKTYTHLFSDNIEFEILISRILSVEQIQNDF